MNISRTLAGTLLAVHAVSAVADPPDQRAPREGQTVLQEPPQALQSAGEPSPARGLSFEGDPSPAQLLADISVRHQLPPEADLVRVRGGASALSGLQYERYQVRLAGVPLHGHGLTLHLRDGRVVGAFGKVPTGLAAETIPQLIEAQARAAAQHAVAAELGRGPAAVSWAPPSPCRLSLRDSGTATAPREYRLYYLCAVDPVAPAGFPQVAWIDAATGTVRELVPQVAHYQGGTWVPAVCSGPTVHHGMVGDLPCLREVDTGKHRLESDSVVAIRTEEYVSDDVPPVGPVYESPEALFDAPDKPGVSVHWGVQTALAAIEGHFGPGMLGRLFDALTAAGHPPPLRAYAEAPYGSAYTEPHTALYPPRMVFGIWQGGPGDGTHMVSLNVVGHEVGHMLAIYVGGLLGTGSSDERAISESFADIVGELAEEVALPGEPNWISNNPPVDRFRDMAEPLNSMPELQVAGQTIPGAPDVWGHTHWNSYWQTDYHLPGLPHSRWFYLLSRDGEYYGTNSMGKQWRVRGVGLRDAARFLSTSVFEVLPEAPTYLDARDSSAQAIRQACGEFSRARIANHNAWHAVNLFPSPLSPLHGFTSPTHLAMGVAPWPATLVWQARETLTETAWHIEIGENPSFDGALATSSSESGMEHGVLAGRLELRLKPATRYYWRVRRDDADPTLESCWRTIRSFVTSDQVPTPVSPIHGQYHPWRLPFQFARVEGATDYQIEVARDVDFQDLVFPIKTFPADLPPAPGDVPAVQTELTVPVGQEVLYWRVRSRYTAPSPDMYSPWSEPKAFGTTTPRATLSSPADNAQVYPWPVPFVWGTVRGATYTLAVDSVHDDVMVPDHRTFRNLPEDEPGLPVNLRAYWASHVGTYEWSVSVQGPRWGSEAQPESPSTREEGELSTVRRVRINGNNTVVERIAPQATTTSQACFAFQDPVTFNWKPVVGAKAYLLEVFEANCRPNKPCLRTDRLVHQQLYPTHQAQPAGSPLSGPFSEPYNIGYAWRVWAQTEEGFRSPDANSSFYFVQPTRPEPTRPAPNEELPPGEVVFGWRSQVAYGGRFLFEVHDGAGCNDLDFSEWTSGFAPGETHLGVRLNSWQNPSTSVPQSWRVRPRGGSSCDTPVLWSTCRSFRVVPHQAPDPSLEAPWVPPEGGSSLGIFFWFERLPWASLYQVFLHEGSPGGPLVAAETYTVNQLREEEERLENGILACTGLPDAFWLYQYSQGPVPPVDYYFRVRACSSAGPCSDWSAWSNFYTFIAWPWYTPPGCSALSFGEEIGLRRVDEQDY